MGKNNLKSNIDFVVPWVDGSDPAWQAEKALYTQDDTHGYTYLKAETNVEDLGSSDKTDQTEVWFGNETDDRDERFRDWDLMRYWFRGVEKFTPWVRKVYFLTWGHVPEWLNTDHPKLNIVNHRDFIPEKYLPTFSSHTIEHNMHHIPGLSEQFVYFNDDMFLIKPTQPELFFKNGLPRGAAVHMPYRTLYGSWFLVNSVNVAVLNKYFSSRKCVLKHPLKWFNPAYGSYMLRTLLMLPYPNFYGLYEDHLPHSYLKSTLEKVWELEPEILDATCSHKIRRAIDVNQWLYEWWQYMEGTFIPRSIKSYGKCFPLGSTRSGKSFAEALSYIENQKGYLVCVNDRGADFDFNYVRNHMAEAFDKIMPEKSAFEKD